MSEKKIVVPEGMLKVATKDYASAYREPITEALEAALRWLSENPIPSTWEDAKGINRKCADRDLARIVVDACCDWQCVSCL